MKRSVRPKLKDDVHLSVFTSSLAFVETPNLLRRVEGDHLELVKEVLLPKLDGTYEVDRIVHDLAGHLDPETVLSILDELDSSDLLENTDSQPTDTPSAIVRLFGDNTLKQLVEPTLVSTGHINAVGEGEPADINLLATRSLMDPSATDLQEQLLNDPLPHIVYGIDFAGNGFIGPRREKSALGACLVCIRTRLTANAPDSEVRAQFIQLLEGSQDTPLLQTPTQALATAMVAWIIQRIGESPDQQASSAAVITLIERDTLTTTHRPLLPVPTCTVCQGHQSRATKTRILDLDDAVDEKTGIVHSAHVRPTRIGPSIHLSGTTSADSSLIRPSMRPANNGGAGFTKREALNAGVGESIERYCAGVYNSDNLRLSTWKNLDLEAVPPSHFAKFSDAQLSESAHGFEPFDTNTLIRWTPSIRWRDGETVLVPASQVYLPYRRVRGEAAIGQSISTGQAAGQSMSAAILGGLREVIERDALAISWMHRLPPRELDPNAIEDSPILRRYLAQRSDWDVRFYDLSLDDLSSSMVAVMEQGEGKDRVLTFGSACRDSAPAALEKAFLEAAQGISFIRKLLPKYDSWVPGENFENVTAFNDHAVLYSKFPELRERAKYLLTREEPTEFRPSSPSFSGDQLDDHARLERLVDQLYRKGYDTYVVDLTTPDAAMLGVQVVKVLVPGYVHVSGSHRDRLLGSTRLSTVPRELGLLSSPDNPYPHPLP